MEVQAGGSRSSQNFETFTLRKPLSELYMKTFRTRNLEYITHDIYLVLLNRS